MSVHQGRPLPPGIAAASSVPPTSDLTLLPGAANLVFWHEAESGITLDTATFRVGTATGSPTITLSGALNQALPIKIGVEVAGAPGGALRIWYAFDENGANRYAENVAAGATLDLGTSGITANLSGTFNADNTFQAVVKEWEPKYGTSGAAGHRWDNSTVTASAGPVYEAHSFQGGIDRASVLLAPALLGNQGTIANLVAGNATPFHLFILYEMTTLPSTASVFALFGFMSQTSTSAHILDWVVTGSTATPPSAWGVQRKASNFDPWTDINSTPTTQRYDSDGTDGFAAVKPDLSPHIFEIEYDGTTMIARVDGFEIATGTWSGTVTSNRATLGGVKLGGNAATAFAIGRVATVAGYNAKLGATDAAAVRAAL
jgi:hypothetical protein